MDSQLRELIDSLGDWTNSGTHSAKVETMALRGDADRLADLIVGAAAAAEDYGDSDRSHVLRELVRRIEEALAHIGGQENVDALFKVQRQLRLAATSPEAIDARLARQRDCAQRLAINNALSVLTQAMARYTADDTVSELRACLFQELVLRRSDMSEHVHLVDPSHRLAWLPSHLHALESEVRNNLAQYSLHGGSQPAPFGPVTERPRLVAVGRANRFTRRRPKNSAERCARMAAAGFHGRAEARLYGLTAPLQGPLDVGRLIELAPRCLKDTTPDQVFVESTTADRALAILFVAAAYGGAYSRPSSGAVGRWVAWRAIGAMAGAGGEASFDDVAASVEGCHWTYFEAANDWFEQVAWDFGLAAVANDGLEIAVIADTDTD